MITLGFPAPAPPTQVNPFRLCHVLSNIFSSDFKIIIRTITCTCGYATYRMIPMAVPARTEDVGNRHEEVHGAGGIVDLLDKASSA